MVLHACAPERRGRTAIGDAIPGHSGKGADFRLAERGYADYPGLYHMEEAPSRRTGACSRLYLPAKTR